jgi:hypothetical protein
MLIPASIKPGKIAPSGIFARKSAPDSPAINPTLDMPPLDGMVGLSFPAHPINKIAAIAITKNVLIDFTVFESGNYPRFFYY